VRELQAMRVSISPAGHDSYAARVGEHDALVLALDLALWAATEDDWLAHPGLGGGDVVPASADGAFFRTPFYISIRLKPTPLMGYVARNFEGCV
jgi:hypothetical protein